MFHRVLAIFEKAYGPNHPMVAGALNSTANFMHEQVKVSRMLAAVDFGRGCLNVVTLIVVKRLVLQQIADDSISGGEVQRRCGITPRRFLISRCGLPKLCMVVLMYAE